MASFNATAANVDQADDGAEWNLEKWAVANNCNGTDHFALYGVQVVVLDHLVVIHVLVNEYYRKKVVDCANDQSKIANTRL